MARATASMAAVQRMASAVAWRRMARAAARLILVLGALALGTGCAAFLSFSGGDSGPRDLATDQWKWVHVPGYWEAQGDPSLVLLNGAAWYRCFVRVPEEWRGEPLLLTMGGVHDADAAFFNGRPVGQTGDSRPGGVTDSDSPRRYRVPPDAVQPGAWNLVAVRVWNRMDLGGITEWHSARSRSVAIALSCRRGWMDLSGRWQLRPGDSTGGGDWPFLAGTRRARGLGEAFQLAAGADAPGRLEDLIVPKAAGGAQATTATLALRYDQPALDWGEALALGNGRLGAMVFGRVHHERIALNCDTLWSGQPYNGDNPEAPALLGAVRKAVALGRYDEAQGRAEHLLHPLPWARSQQEFEPLGNLRIAMTGGGGGEPIEDYGRELDLERGIARVTWRSGGARFTRETFVSAPAHALVVRITCDQPGRISLFATLDSPLDAQARSIAHDYLLLRGLGPNHANLEGNMTFEAHLRARVDGGRVLGHPDTLEVRDADAVTLLLAAGTSAVDYHSVAEDPGPVCEAILTRALAQPYETLRAAHEADMAALLGGTSLHLRRIPNALAEEAARALAPIGALTTDARIGRAAHIGIGTDPGLVELLFAQGRYLLASASRPGGGAAGAAAVGQPANAQGIWGDSTTPPRGARLRLSGPTPATYWPAETTGLGECAEPLVALTARLAERGRTTARIQYGAPGWVAHHQTDLWCDTAPSESVATGLWPCGGAWLCHHLWEHYAFGPGDREYLRRVYPTMRGAAEFFLATLQPTGREADSRLAVNPSISPDNTFLTPFGRTAVSDRAASDAQLVDDLFGHCARAAEILGVDPDLRKRLDAARARLHPVEPPLEGPLPQWQGIEAHGPTDTVPHLFALYPGDGASVHGTPQYVPALRGALEEAGPGRSAWTRAWRAALWARLENGDCALDALGAILTSHTLPNLMTTGAGRAFEMAGNAAASAAIAEMLVQSQAGCAVLGAQGGGRTPGGTDKNMDGGEAFEVQLLPALPAVWAEGEAHGLRARGGHEVGLEWSGGRLTRATIRAGASGRCYVRSRTPIESVLEAGASGDRSAASPQRGPEDGVIVLSLEAGRTYELLTAAGSVVRSAEETEAAQAAETVRASRAAERARAARVAEGTRAGQAEQDAKAAAQSAEEEAARAPLKEAAPVPSPATSPSAPASNAAEAARVAREAEQARVALATEESRVVEESRTARAAEEAHAAQAEAAAKAAAQAAEEEALWAPLREVE